MSEIVYDNWYNYPQYYECFFRKETAREVRFIEWAARHLANVKVRRVLELGCGGGRLILRLARRGYRCYALDNNQQALELCRRRAQRKHLPVTTLESDLADFALPEKVELAICTWNTIRHLLSEQAARRHLQRVAEAVCSGGLYIIGLHLLPLDVAEEAEERWSARWGHLKLHARLRVESTDRKRRLEWLGLRLTIRSPRRTRRFECRFALRMYTLQQFLSLIHYSGYWQIVGVYDFWYDWRRPRKLDNNLIDAVFVLRRD
ncbi:MAG: class I SAM-dependent methyltransferase [Gemmatales bacterium]|nr:class I SAM-dependent methyltransferase [Gemmatales bacterium]MDW7995517.1 class I SAM-dependent methyltransferase [Gemmatales bacterium]